jgi:uncharacterized protein YbjT (DUF2867 family)
MFAIAGVTGHVGSAAASALLRRGERVTALVRDARKGEPWSLRGAEVAVADLGDRDNLADAIGGSQGFFVLLPTNYGATDLYADQRRLSDAITGAVKDSDIPHVVMLSTAGADLAEGTGPIVGLHYLENRLRECVLLSIVRARNFHENVESVIEVARHSGIYPNFGDSADIPIPMTATPDVGELVAEALMNPPSASEVIDLEGPAYTHRQVAEKLGAALGKPLQVVNIARTDWVGTMMDAGLSRHIAEALAEMYDAGQRGLLQPRGDRQLKGHTGLDETLVALVQRESLASTTSTAAPSARR